DLISNGIAAPPEGMEGLAAQVGSDVGTAAGLGPPAAGEAINPDRRSASAEMAPAEAGRASTVRPRLLDAVRVSADKLDRLRDAVGELLLMRARLEMSALELRKLREATTEQRERQAATNLQRSRELGPVLETITGIETRMRDDGHRVGRLASELDTT